MYWSSYRTKRREGLLVAMFRRRDSTRGAVERANDCSVIETFLVKGRPRGSTIELRALGTMEGI